MTLQFEGIFQPFICNLLDPRYFVCAYGAQNMSVSLPDIFRLLFFIDLCQESIELPDNKYKKKRRFKDSV